MKMPPCLSSPVTHHTTTRKITSFLSTSSSYTKQCLEAVECRQDKLVIALTAISVYLQIYTVYLQQCTHLRLGYTFLNLRKSNRIQQLWWYCNNLPKSSKTNWSQVTANGGGTYTARFGFCAVTLLWIVI